MFWDFRDFSFYFIPWACKRGELEVHPEDVPREVTTRAKDTQGCCQVAKPPTSQKSCLISTPPLSQDVHGSASPEAKKPPHRLSSPAPERPARIFQHHNRSGGFQSQWLFPFELRTQSGPFSLELRGLIRIQWKWDKKMAATFQCSLDTLSPCLEPRDT